MKLIIFLFKISKGNKEIVTRWKGIEIDMDNQYRLAECVHDGSLKFKELPGLKNHYNINRPKYTVYNRESKRKKKQFFSSV